jgi:hypothetical protein
LGFPQVSTFTAGIAGAIGGPAFWILAGLDLLKHAEPETRPQGAPTLAHAK